MRAKQRNKDSLPTSIGRTFRFYMPVSLYDQLEKESIEKDIAISRLLRNKLELINKVSYLVLQENYKKLR